MSVCIQDVESLGHKLGFSEDIGNFHIVSLGQGQEVVAEQAMELGTLKGHWVMLQVIHNFCVIYEGQWNHWSHLCRKWKILLM